LPAGFEPVQRISRPWQACRGWTSDAFASVLEYGGARPATWSCDDRVNLYFDRIWGDTVGAIPRPGVDPGEFVLPPAARMMYQGDSTGYSETGRVVIR
jgi:hypothetical protein